MGDVPIDFLLKLLDGLLQREPQRRLSCTQAASRLRALGLAPQVASNASPLSTTITQILAEAPIFSRTLEVASEALVSRCSYQALVCCDEALEEVQGVPAEHAALPPGAWHYMVACVRAYVLAGLSMKARAVEALEGLLESQEEGPFFAALGARREQALAFLRAQLATWLLPRSRSEDALNHLKRTLRAGGLRESELTRTLVCLGRALRVQEPKLALEMSLRALVAARETVREAGLRVQGRCIWGMQDWMVAHDARARDALKQLGDAKIQYIKSCSMLPECRLEAAGLLEVESHGSLPLGRTDRCLMLANLYWDMGMADKAQSALKQIRYHKPHTKSAYCEMMGDLEGALEEQKRCVWSQPYH